MRTPREIAAEINATTKRVHALQDELELVRRIERETIVRMFVQGRSIDEIAIAMRMTYPAVQGSLRRAGMTVKGRDALACMLDANLAAALRHRAPERQMAGGAS